MFNVKQTEFLLVYSRIRKIYANSRDSNIIEAVNICVMYNLVRYVFDLPQEYTITYNNPVTNFEVEKEEEDD